MAYYLEYIETENCHQKCHVNKLEEEYWLRGRLMEEELEKFMINISFARSNDLK
jgi:hypothetical protein